MTRHNPIDGELYIAATPIGNMDDITLRTLNILKNADIIAAEDTRKTGKLLSCHGIKSKMISFHEHNEKNRAPELIKKISQGNSVVLVTDAGTPTISDPGYRLVKSAVENNINIIPLPGASALTTALSASGLPTDAFIFIGFPPKTKKKRQDQLRDLASERKTLIFYESPKRIIALLQDIIEIMGARKGVIGREMTKKHEEFIRGSISNLLDTLNKKDSIKGEFTVIIEGVRNSMSITDSELQDEIKNRIKTDDISPSDLAKKIARQFGIPRKRVYEAIISMKNIK